MWNDERKDLGPAALFGSGSARDLDAVAAGVLGDQEHRRGDVSWKQAAGRATVRTDEVVQGNAEDVGGWKELHAGHDRSRSAGAASGDSETVWHGRAGVEGRAGEIERIARFDQDCGQRC